ncbi:lysophospholipid acyltransferase family protein, partial [Roseomonas mucosa]
SMVRQSREFAERDGAQLVIFPEGTRTAPGERVPWQPGVAALASATGLPVVPAATDSGRFWGRRSFAKRPGTITLAILPALPPGLPRAELMRRLEDEVETASAAMLQGSPLPGP